MHKDPFTTVINHHDPKIKRLGKACSKIYVSYKDPLYCYPPYILKSVDLQNHF